MKSKCIKPTKQGLAKIKSWIERGNPNVRHYEIILEAELSAYQGRTFLVKKQYETAITIATRAGFVHDSALANEKYGEYILQIETEQIHHAHARNPHQISTRTIGGSRSNENLQEATFRLQESIDFRHSFMLLSSSSIPNHVEVSIQQENEELNLLTKQFILFIFLFVYF